MAKKIVIQSMQCEHCVDYIKKTLEKLKGVMKVEVNLETQSALAMGLASNEEIKEAIEKAGYDVVSISRV
jgi:copper chaperone CopZ